ncbi:MAG TPA: threonine/serine exporter family protein, partial [Smithella sp.]|nr:threonine/serine exporter family protein [Smithella sp.]
MMKLSCRPVTPPDPRPGGGRGSSRLVAGTRRAFRPSGPPTDELPVFVHPDEVADVTARAVVDLALRAGIAMLSTGAPAADVVATVLQLTRAYGMTSVHVDI